MLALGCDGFRDAKTIAAHGLIDAIRDKPESLRWETVKHRTQTLSRMYKEKRLTDADIYGDLDAIVAGDKPWVTTDRLRVTISNDDAGKFQQFWRRYYGRQLPSSDTNSISEPAL